MGKEWVEVNREEQMERGERKALTISTPSETEGRGGGVTLLEEPGKKALRGHSYEITMQFKSLPNLSSYY